MHLSMEICIADFTSKFYVYVEIQNIRVKVKPIKRVILHSCYNNKKLVHRVQAYSVTAIKP